MQRSSVVVAANLFIGESKPLFNHERNVLGGKVDIVKTECGVKMEERHIFK